MFRVRRPAKPPSPLDIEIVELTFEVSAPTCSATSGGTPVSSLNFDGMRLLGRSARVQLAVLTGLIGTMVVLARVPGPATRFDMAASGEPTTTGSSSAPTLRPTLTFDAADVVSVDAFRTAVEP